ncbi:MAG TPA: AAA family ATPase [Verrucomicrobiales bacterium]|nr:AAA family ATPase [Verrucomicrobiales bacterium]
MIPPVTQRVLDFLADARSYPHRTTAVRLVQTHASWVFIASPFVYKVKKPVNFGFLDFSTLERRKANCESEVRLNRRLAAEIYRGMEPVCETGGGLEFGDRGRIVEWTVKMREMAPECFLSHRLKHGEVTTETMDRVVERLERFYADQPPLPAAEVALARQRLDESVRGNFDAARDFTGHSLSAAALGAIERFSAEFEARHRDLLDSRIAQGWIRDCHGDLHAEHIHLTPEAVQIYDCIEFNEAFRHIDVASDIAFLAMDLDFNGRADLAQHIAGRFAALLRDDGLPRLMDYYKCYRACVRGKVENLHSTGETVGEAERLASLDLARRYFRLALRYAIAGSAPGVWVFWGRVASGKSALAEALEAETGWRVVSSDRVRKALAGVQLCQRGTAEERRTLYSEAMTQRVYDTLCDEAIHTAKDGQNVILDATFSNHRHRDALRRGLERHGLGSVWIVAEASPETALQRLRQRDQEGSAISDARSEDYDRLSSRFEAPAELSAANCVRVSTEDDPDTTLFRLLNDLAARQARLHAGPELLRP